jgi:hypothetical protein
MIPSKSNWNIVKLGHYELGYNDQSVITNMLLGKNGIFLSQIRTVVTNPSFNEQK